MQSNFSKSIEFGLKTYYDYLRSVMLRRASENIFEFRGEWDIPFSIS